MMTSVVKNPTEIRINVGRISVDIACASCCQSTRLTETRNAAKTAVSVDSLMPCSAGAVLICKLITRKRGALKIGNRY